MNVYIYYIFAYLYTYVCAYVFAYVYTYMCAYVVYVYVCVSGVSMRNLLTNER